MIKRIFLTITILSGLIGINSFNVKASEATIIGPSLIQKEQYQVLTLSDILNLYSSTLGGVSIETDNYTGFGAVLGEHHLELVASDGQAQASKSVTIEVLPAIGYGVRAVTDQVNIHIAKTNKLNPQDLVQIHSKTGVVELNHTTQMAILTDNYSATKETPGTYLFEYRIMDATGLDKTVSFTITVYESERINSPIISIPKEPGVFDALKNILSTFVTIAVLGFLGFIGFKIYLKVRKVK